MSEQKTGGIVVMGHVKQEEIDNGEACSSCNCALAAALKRYFPQADYISVGVGRVQIGTDKKNYEAKLSDAQNEFTAQFDQWAMYWEYPPEMRHLRGDEPPKPEPIKFQLEFKWLSDMPTWGEEIPDAPDMEG